MERRHGLEKSLGEVLREWRLEAGFSQEGLAEKADLHRNYVGLVERGVNSPSVSALTALAMALGRRPSDLLREAESRSAKREIGRAHV